MQLVQTWPIFMSKPFSTDLLFQSVEYSTTNNDSFGMALPDVFLPFCLSSSDVLFTKPLFFLSEEVKFMGTSTPVISNQTFNVSILFLNAHQCRTKMTGNRHS